MPNTFAQHLRRNLTGLELKLWRALRRLRAEGFHLRRQVPFGKFALDFASHRERLAIEVDGRNHLEPRQRAYDEARTRFIEARGFMVVRYTNDQVLGNIDGVMENLLPLLNERRRIKFTGLPPPDPALPDRPPLGGGGRALEL